MLTLTLRLTCLLLLSAAGSCFSQGKLTSFQQYRIPEKRVFRGIRSVYAKSDSEVVVLGLCKNYSVTLPSSLFLSGKPEAKTDRRDVPFLRIHGNVLYDFLYRSFVDTPFYQQNLQQHTVQTYLSISVRNRYPFNVYLTNRQGNSPYFQNDFNLSL